MTDIKSDVELVYSYIITSMNRFKLIQYTDYVKIVYDLCLSISLSRKYAIKLTGGQRPFVVVLHVAVWLFEQV